jgi:hypothetical protein
MQYVVNQFWKLIRTTGQDCVKFKAYKELHCRIGKTIQPRFTEKEADKSAERDWHADLKLHGDEKMAMLNHDQFTAAMYQLVDEYCDNFPSSGIYIDFLQLIYTNIVGPYEVIPGKGKGGKKTYKVTSNVEFSKAHGFAVEYRFLAINQVRPNFHVVEELKAQHKAVHMVQTLWRRKKGLRQAAPPREQQIRGSGGSLEPPGPLLTHLHTVYMAFSERFPTRLNPLAERTCLSQAPPKASNISRCLAGKSSPGRVCH